MSYSIIGSGAIGSALAMHFANKGIEVSQRSPMPSAQYPIGEAASSWTPRTPSIFLPRPQQTWEDGCQAKSWLRPFPVRIS